MSQPRLSILDTGTMPLSIRLAPRVEALGYHRYWISEHHGQGAISTPTLLVPLIARLTERIRVGTAGVLLQFQSALSVAESFRMLQHVFADRIDLGIGRSEVATQAQTAALRDGRREPYTAADHAEKVAEVQRILCGRFSEGHPLADQRIDPPLTSAGPPPLWVLSTSYEGAALAARLGAHYSFHDYFNPHVGPMAIRKYVEEFQPSPELGRPSWNVCVTGYCAPDKRGHPIPPLPNRPGRRVIIGTTRHWEKRLAELMEAYDTEEIVIQTLWGDYDLEQQVSSFERIARAAAAM